MAPRGSRTAGRAQAAAAWYLLGVSKTERRKLRGRLYRGNRLTPRQTARCWAIRREQIQGDPPAHARGHFEDTLREAGLEIVLFEDGAGEVQGFFAFELRLEDVEGRAIALLAMRPLAMAKAFRGHPALMLSGFTVLLPRALLTRRPVYLCGFLAPEGYAFWRANFGEVSTLGGTIDNPTIDNPRSNAVLELFAPAVGRDRWDPSLRLYRADYVLKPSRASRVTADAIADYHVLNPHYSDAMLVAAAVELSPSALARAALRSVRRIFRERGVRLPHIAKP